MFRPAVVHRTTRVVLRVSLSQSIISGITSPIWEMAQQVRQHDVLTGADPPGDRLADRAGSNDDNDFVHDEFSSSYALG